MLGIAVCLAIMRMGTAQAAEAGSLDPSFGDGGVAPPQFTTSGGFHSTGVALQGDGKVVVAGWTTPGSTDDYAVARFTSAGQPDPTFGGDGSVTTHLGGSEQANGLAVQPDGKIVLVGQRSPFASTGRGFQFVRYLSNGNLDTSFSGDGKLIVPGPLAGPSLEGAHDVVVQPDGKIVAAGFTRVGDNVAVVRLTNSGVVDRTFSGDGIAVLPADGYNGAYAVGLQPDGKIVVAGISDFDALVARFTPAGAVDTSYGTNGFTVVQTNSSFRPLLDLVVQPDGKTIAVGTVDGGQRNQIAVHRFTTAGQPDPAFSQDGLVTTNFSNGSLASSVALQGDGRIVVVGHSYSTRVIARYLADGSPDASFGAGGVHQPWPLDGDTYDDAVIQPDGRLVVSCCGSAARFVMTPTTPPTGPSCEGLQATLVGTAGNDTLNGTAGPDVIVGGAGNDTINGLGGDDRICAGDGADVLVGGGGADRVYGEAGADQLIGYSGPDHIDGGADVDIADFNYATGPITADLASGTANGEGSDQLLGIEWLAGSPHADDLRGDAAANRLYGRGGEDRLDGREGDDMVFGSAANDVLIGGLGSDSINLAAAPGPVRVDLAAGTSLGEGSDTVTGVEHVIGSAFADVLAGNDLANVLNAGAGNDQLAGAGGNDSLYGGDGGDQLSGGLGSDLCDGGPSPAGVVDSADATCEALAGIP